MRRKCRSQSTTAPNAVRTAEARKLSRFAWKFHDIRGGKGAAVGGHRPAFQGPFFFEPFFSPTALVQARKENAMNTNLISHAILIAAGLAAGVTGLNAQSNADINRMLADTNRLISQSHRDLQQIRRSQGLPPLTGNAAYDNRMMQREQQAAFSRYLNTEKRCGAGDQRACQEASRYAAAQRRTTGMLGALNARDRISNSVTRHQYEQNWRNDYNRARYNEYYYDKIQKNAARRDYWKQQAEDYKPPYGK
jgi:hypothetical protein